MSGERVLEVYGAENVFGKEVEEGSISGGETIPNKRIKETSIDRLSALPDSLIIYILSLLGGDVKEAAVTSVLSKRWQFLWTELPSLLFWDHNWEVEKTRDFVSWVHRTLLLRSAIHLEEFRVDFMYDECYAPDVNVWVRIAVRKKVKELNLVLHARTCFYKLPQVLYSSSSLTWLRIERCIVAPHTTIRWQSLSRLMVEDMELDENIIQKILSGCPVLHTLTIRSCWGFKLLDLNSKSLYKLRLSDSEEKNRVPLLEISAPYLSSLDISFSPTEKKLQLTNVPSLVIADIHFNISDNSVELMNNTKELLEKTLHAKDLILGGACVEVLSLLVANGWKLPQSRRKNLVLNTWRDENSILGILGLLESSPNLETLLIECCDSYEKSVRTWVPASRDDLDCDLLNLKIVRLLDFADPKLAGEPMLTIARILLKRAASLEKMKIKALGSLTEFASEFTKMSDMVLSYPRSSGKVVVVLRQ